MLKKIFLSLLLALILSGGYSQNAKHVVLIGLDGVSSEGFQYARTPVMDELIRNGSLSLITRSVIPSVSAPNWATILSGAGPEQHGVTSNEWSFSNEPFEPTVKDSEGYFTSIFTIIRKQAPKAITGMFYDWDWLGTFINPGCVTESKYVQGYRNVTPLAANFFKANKPLFTFVYYSHPDEVGHQTGHGTQAYYQSITDVDSEIGILVAALKESGMYQSTCILVVSDHGGINKGHGGESRVEMEVPWLINGPGIGKNRLLQNPNDQFNTAPTIARLLGLKQPMEWIGRPDTEAFLLSSDKNRKFKKYIAKPSCSLKEGVYPSAQTIELGTLSTEATIYYTLDGSTPEIHSTKYTGSIKIDKNCIVSAIALSGNNSSQVAIWRFTFLKGVSEVTLTNPPSPTYPGTGALSLFDGLIGSSNFKGKQWMGWEGNDFEAIVDFGQNKEIHGVGLDVLQQPASWIFLPSMIEFYTSSDGMNFTQVASYNPSEIDDIRKNGPVLLARMFEGLNTRYLRIKAFNIGTCPAGHPGEGGKAWLFISEIEVE